MSARAFKLVRPTYVLIGNPRIEKLNLSVRAYNCLKRAGIDTISQFKELSEEQIKGIRNMGKKPMEEIIEKLNQCHRVGGTK